MEFAVVNTLDFMDHKMYESDPDLMKALNKIYIDYEKHVIPPTSWEVDD